MAASGTAAAPARVLLVSGFDSGLKYADRVAGAVEEAGGTAVLAAPTTTSAAHRLGARQIAAATARPVEFAAWEALVARAAGFDAVVPVFDGPRVQAFFRDVHDAADGAPPVLGAGYIGMVLNDAAGGYLMRSLADVVAVNSRTDLGVFRRTAEAFDLPAAPLLLAGLPLLPAAPEAPATGPIRTVLFADQPTVPAGLRERTWLWDRLAAYAERHPGRRVLLRPRHAPGEDTFHRMLHSPDQWAARRALPPNLLVTHRPIHELLLETDLLLTVSSTAALESVAAGIRTALVGDLLNDAALNPPLIPSGLIRRFDDVDEDRLGAPDPAWVDDVFPAATGATPAARFAEQLLAVARGDAPRSHAAAWDSRFHAGRRRVDAELAELGGLALAGRSRYAPRRVAAGVLRRALRTVEH